VNSLTTADIADELGTTARNLRKFLRSPASPYEAVGQGSRYNINSADLADVKKLYEAWVARPGSRSTSTDSAKRTPRKPKVRITERVDPLENDGDLMFRLTHTVGDRQRMAGVVCDYEWHHPKVKGLDVKCTNKPVKGSRQCANHQQVTYCGDQETPQDNLCGPGGKHPKPYCKWHNAELSEDELAELLTLDPSEWN